MNELLLNQIVELDKELETVFKKVTKGLPIKLVKKKLIKAIYDGEYYLKAHNILKQMNNTEVLITTSITEYVIKIINITDYLSEAFVDFKKVKYSISLEDVETIRNLTEKYAKAYYDNNVVIPSSNEREKEKFIFNYLDKSVTLNSKSIDNYNSCEFIDFLSKMDIHNTINTIFLKYDILEKYFVTMNKYDKKGDSYRIKRSITKL